MLVIQKFMLRISDSFRYSYVSLYRFVIQVREYMFIGQGCSKSVLKKYLKKCLIKKNNLKLDFGVIISNDVGVVVRIFIGYVS